MQEIFASEVVILPTEDDTVDAALHSVLLMLYHFGWTEAYPGLKGALIDAMDEAAGDCGYYFCYDNEACGAWKGANCSGIYHDSQDRKCDKDCLLPEYFALALTAATGTFELRPEACKVLVDFWSVCSAADLQSANP
eukprot:scaffold60624_cov39-Prasinocladus_malaysianus.AAC.1